MRTKYLQCFLVLAEEQHYHRAAERLNVSSARQRFIHLRYTVQAACARRTDDAS